MKILKIVLIACAGLFIFIVAGCYIFLKTVDLNKYIPTITQEAKKAFGREVKIGRVEAGFSWSHGLGLQAKDIVIADDARFSDKPFLTVMQVSVGVDVVALVWQQKVCLTEIVIVSPEITVIRSKEGLINAAMLADSMAQASAAMPREQKAAAAVPALLIRDIRVSGGKMVYVDKEVSSGALFVLENFAAKARVDGLRVDISKFSVAIAGGTVSGDAQVQDFLTTPKVKAVFYVQGVDVKKLLGGYALPVHVGGVLAGDAHVEFTGNAPEQVLASLNGSVKGDLNGGIIENVNLLALGLGRIPMLPNLLEGVMADFPPETQEEIRQGVTRLQLCKAEGRLVNGVFELDAAELRTRDIFVAAHGRIDLRKDMDLRMDVRILQSLSDRLGSSVKEVAALKDEQGLIYVPFNVKGPLMRPAAIPDVGYLAKKILVANSGDALKEVLGTPEAAQAVDAIFDLFKKK